MKKNKFLYVVGSPRSGSTVIYRSLCNDNKINPPLPETHLVDQMIRMFVYQTNRFSIEENYLFDNEQDLASYINICLEKFFYKIQKKYSVNILILKSIVCSQYADIIHHIFPKLSFIFCIRDPRDIVASMIKVGKQQEKLGIQNQFPRDMEKLCKKINTSYRILLTEGLRKNFCDSIELIKYEEFVANPLMFINKISKNLSLEIKFKKNLSVWKKSRDLVTRNNFGYESQLWNKPISNSNIGVYKNYLSHKEITIIDNLCSKLILKYNY